MHEGGTSVLVKLRLLLEQNQKLQENVTQVISTNNEKLAATEALRLLLLKVDSSCSGSKIRRRNIVIRSKYSQNTQDKPLCISHSFSVSCVPREGNLPDPFKIARLHVSAPFKCVRLMPPPQSVEDVDYSALEKIFPPIPRASTCSENISTHKSLPFQHKDFEVSFPNSTRGRVHIKFHSKDSEQRSASEVLEQFKRSFEGKTGRRILQQNWPDSYSCLAHLLVNYLMEELCRYDPQDRLKSLLQNYLLMRWTYLQLLVEKATYPFLFACENDDFLGCPRVRVYRKIRGGRSLFSERSSFVLAALIAYRADIFKSSTFLDRRMSLSLFLSSSELVDFRSLLKLKVSELFKKLPNTC